LQRGVVDKLQGTLDSQVDDLEAATQAAKDYSSTLAMQLLGGIDLGAAQETGAELGISTLDAFDRQIEPRRMVRQRPVVDQGAAAPTKNLSTNSHP
jgi:hypothetical protein